MGWHKLVFVVCHCQRIVEGVALLYPAVAGPAHPCWPPKDASLVLYVKGMGTTHIKVHSFVLFLFTQE